MNFRINEGNHVTIDPAKGSRIQQLTLGGKNIINCEKTEGNFLASGSYLMFPWVNRIKKNPYQKVVKNQFHDQNGYPLHGLFANTKREMKVQQMKQNGNIHTIKITSQNAVIHKQIHSFVQTFTLSQNNFQIDFKALISKQDPNPFCFGYHPYFQLSKPFCQLKLETNLKRQIHLQQDLLVSYPRTYTQWSGQLNSNQFYDSLFQAGQGQQKSGLDNFVTLSDGVSTIRVQSDLEYWQIYTPEDGRRVAIQPMSFHAGVYQGKGQLVDSGSIRVSLE